MPKNQSLFKVRAKVWLYPGVQAAWHFASIPKKQSEEIRKRFGAHARGWGSLPVEATVGKTTWKSSIFPDKRMGLYILPLKLSVRTKEGIMRDSTISLTLKINV